MKILVHDVEARRETDNLDHYFASAVARRDSLTAGMRKKNFSMLDDLDSVLLVSERVEFTGEREVLVTGGNETLRITAETVIINTGSIPAAPQIDGARISGQIHDPGTLQCASLLPRSLVVVVGDGYVGLEFASMFAQFGSDVTVLDRKERPLKSEDTDAAKAAVEALSSAGVTIISGATVTGVVDERERAHVSYQVDGQARQFEAEAVLLALGRTPATEGLGLEQAGVDTDGRGYVVVDAQLHASASGVYAVGDVNGGPQFTDVSLDDNRIVADQLFGAGTRSADQRVAVPYTMFLTPLLARVGLTEDEAREQGFGIKIGVKLVADIAAAPRPKIEGDPRGIVKVVVDGASDKVLGAAILMVHSQELINLSALAMRHGFTASELRDGIYTHSSSTEALNEVLAALQ